MSRYKLYKHLIETNVFNTRTKIKNFVKPRVTKARKSIKVTS